MTVGTPAQGHLWPGKPVCNTRSVNTISTATGADAVRAELFADLSIEVGHLGALDERLEADFTVEDRGFAQLGAITDDYDRAVISDQIDASVGSTATNLLEARLHQRDIEERTGDDGIGFPTEETAKERTLQGVKTERDITGWGRGLCSALDCLAACAIGVLRIPISIRKASFSPLVKLSELMVKGTAAQQQSWTGLVAIIETHRSDYPTGWFDWLSGVRHLNIHRARQINVLLQRTKDDDQEALIFVAEDPTTVDEVTKTMARFDLHLRQRPQLSDMQDLIEAPKATDIWIAEPAQNTLAGVFLTTNQLVEEIAGFLLDQWVAIGDNSTDFPVPADKWKPDRNIPAGFEGVTGVASSFKPAKGQLHTHPALAKRLALAEELATTQGSRRPGAHKP